MRKLTIYIFSLGLITMIVQIVTLREFMFLFGGNEMIIGIFLANWMILTGSGTFIGKTAKNMKNKVRMIHSVFIILSWLPVIMIFLISVCRNLIFKPGIEIGLFQITTVIAVFLAPFCFLSGFLFTILTKVNIISNPNVSAEQTYSTEAFGSLIAGFFSSFIFFYWFSNFQIIILLTFLVPLVIMFPLNKRLNFKHFLPVLFSAAFAIVMFALRADYLLKGLIFENQIIKYLKDTPYGNLTVTKTDNQINVFENGRLLFSTDNQISNEESVHYAMLQHPEPKNILLISGGISGITKEILKYNVEKIDYIEINPEIFVIGKKFTHSLDDDRIRTISHDARIYIHKTDNNYDVVLINLPEPSTAELNRYYTVEFLIGIKKILNKQGIIMMSLPSTANYINEEARQLNSVIYNTCKRVFNNVIVIPGERNYFLISDMKLTTNITQLIENKNIETVYLNTYYINGIILQQRSDYLMRNLNQNTQINTDFKPVSYFYYLGYWLSQFNLGRNTLWFIFITLLVVIIAISIFFRPVTSAIMITGFSASAIEIILLLSLQILFGYIYQVIGICIAVFMGGLAFGAFYRKRIFGNANFIQFAIIQLSTGVSSLVIPLLLNHLHFHMFLGIGIIMILLFLVSFLTGLMFSLSIHLRKGELTGNVATLYSSDLIGSALGAFTTSVFLIPLAGLKTSAYLLGMLNIVFAIYLFIRKNKF